MAERNLTKKDVEKLCFVRKSLVEGTACTIEKGRCVSFLDDVLEPKCAVCRRVIGEDLVVVNERKMHVSCRSKYRN